MYTSTWVDVRSISADLRGIERNTCDERVIPEQTNVLNEACSSPIAVNFSPPSARVALHCLDTLETIWGMCMHVRWRWIKTQVPATYVAQNMYVSCQKQILTLFRLGRHTINTNYGCPRMQPNVNSLDTFHWLDTRNLSQEKCSCSNLRTHTLFVGSRARNHCARLATLFLCCTIGSDCRGVASKVRIKTSELVVGIADCENDFEFFILEMLWTFSNRE